MKKRIISAILVLAIAFSLIPCAAFEAEAATILYWPVPGHTSLSRGYKTAKHPNHEGLDIHDSNIKGATIVAAVGGTVVNYKTCTEKHPDKGTKCWCNGTGTGIAIYNKQLNRTYSYAHMLPGSIPANIGMGTEIKAGQVIGRVGTTGNSTGYHLHFSISKGTKYWVNSVNPSNETYRYGTAPAAYDAPKLTSKIVDNGVQITLSTNVSGGTIYYTTNGKTPISGGKKYTGPFVVTSTSTIRAYVLKNGQYSPEMSKKVTVGKAETPVITAQLAASGFNVTIASESGATIYYTLDGTDPTTSSTRYNGPFTVSQSGTIKAIAVKSGKNNSVIASASCTAEVPSVPKPSLDASCAADMGVQDNICVKWAAVKNAYEYVYTVTSGGETVYTATTQSGVANYIPEQPGTYEITVKAVNFMGRSEASAPPVTVTVHPDVTVRFEDYDGTLIEEQHVHYNKDAVVPAAPSRVGHTFTKWSGSYTGVKKNTTVTASYVANTYSVRFVDSDGNQLGGELVEYGKAVSNVPAAPQRTGYSFAAWSVKSGEGNSYTCVNGNVVFEPTYTWTDPAMPVAVSVERAVRNTDAAGYTVTVRAVNATDSAVNGKLITVIKTATDKVVATKIDVITIPANATDYTQTVVVGGTAVGSVAEVYVVANDKENDNRTGGAYSRAASGEVTQESSSTATYWSEWSDWSTTEAVGSDTTEVEVKTQYRYRDMETTTSTSATLEGWTQNGSSVTYGAWSSWSALSPTKQTASATKEVATGTLYKYQHYCNGKGAIAPYDGYGNSVYGPHILYFTSKQKVSRTSSSTGLSITDGLTRCANGANGYYYMGTVTGYKYRTRTATTNYSYYRWGDFSEWEDTACSASSTREVETRTVYRYRTLETRVTTENKPYLGEEDTSGTSYRITGSLSGVSADYSGMAAIVMVYKDKNIDPTEDQMEYIGQITLGDGNSYDFSFVPKEEIREETGNYIVSFGIATADGLINNAEIIEAPKPSYNVVFIDHEGNILSKQSVTEGEDAQAPALEDVQGYEITWNRSFTNIHADTEVRAVAVARNYNVIFVDWANDKIVSIVEAAYGEAVTFPADCSAEGKIFRGWSIPEGSVVTGTTVVEAVYEDIEYTVTFLNQDGSVYTTQQVHHGESVSLPEENPAAEGFLFMAWSNESNWWNVTEDVTVEPVFIFEETVEAPVLNSGAEEDPASGQVDMDSSTDEAIIYFTTDGSEPTEEDLVFDEIFWVEETTTVKAKAFKEGMNPSETVEFVIEVTASSDLPGVSALTDHERYAVGTDTVSIPMRVDNPDGLNILGYGVFMDPADGGAEREYWNQLTEPITDAVIGRVFTVKDLAQDTQYTAVLYVEFEGLGVISSDPILLTTDCDHEHSYSDTVVEPTCTETGCVVHECTACGKVYSDRHIPVTNHSFTDGVCTGCGISESEVDLFLIPSTNMTLGNSLAMNFWVNEADIEGTDYYAEIVKTYADGRDNVTVQIPFDQWKYNAGYKMYYFTFDGIAAKEMGDELYVTVYSTEGTRLSQVKTDSIRDYVTRNISKWTGETRTMGVDMLNYGAAAQNYFKYDAENPVNEAMAAYQQYATQDVTMNDGRVKGTNYVGSTLKLESSIILGLYFQNLTRDMRAVVTFTDHYGNEKTVNIPGSEFDTLGTYLGVEVDALVIADGSRPVTCTVYDAEGNEVASAIDSVESYIARMSNLDVMFEMIMRFSASSYAYFH